MDNYSWKSDLIVGIMHACDLVSKSWIVSILGTEDEKQHLVHNYAGELTIVLVSPLVLET